MIDECMWGLGGLGYSFTQKQRLWTHFVLDAQTRSGNLILGAPVPWVAGDRCVSKVVNRVVVRGGTFPGSRSLFVVISFSVCAACCWAGNNSV